MRILLIHTHYTLVKQIVKVLMFLLNFKINTSTVLGLNEVARFFIRFIKNETSKKF